MSLTNDQLLARIVVIESKLNEIQVAMNNLVTKKTVNNLAALREQQIDTLTTRVSDLETQLEVLQDD